jgi:hypothetical protein
MTRVDETVEVSVNQSGEPVGFSWREERYLVIARPVRWFARRDWWAESARANRGIGAAVLETEMWGLTANGVQGTAKFELVHSRNGNRWQLVRVYR